MWKECLAMMNLRKWSIGRQDTHGYRGRGQYSRSSVTISLEPTEEPEPEPDAESMRSFAKVADSDISEAEMETDFFSEPIMVSLEESISDVSSRPQRASTTFSSSPQINRQTRASTTNVNVLPSRLSRDDSSSGNLSRPSTQSYSNSPTISRQAPAESPARIQSTPNPVSSYEEEIIKLLNDSVAGLANLPEPSMDFSNPSLSQQSSFSSRPLSMSNVTQSMHDMTLSSPPPSAISMQQREPPSQKAEGDQRCVVCLDNAKNSILYQCGHVCTCLDCGKQLVARKMTCPMCRAPIKDCIAIFK